MFRAKTVLVIGAGASVEVGLPMGPDLLKQIVKLTHITFEHYSQKDGDRAIYKALQIILNEGGEVTKMNQHLHAAWQLSESAMQALSMACCRFGGHRDKVFPPIGGPQCKEGS
ncbi:hypothetical protein, partial [Rhizorhapis sp. SPR117]|uniref:hypothetical protein n=1 Tax=Rhizorhapis sp. SPR117 TaxID=2912611 RepID=UPI001F3402EA|nr:hypothetical protein [Rhizorhapis sp. SPR117]